MEVLEHRGSADAAAEIAAPCRCGCGKQAGATAGSRLGPVLLSESIALPAACASEPASVKACVASSRAPAPPEPVPLSRFA